MLKLRVFVRLLKPYSFSFFPTDTQPFGKISAINAANIII